MATAAIVCNAAQMADRAADGAAGAVADARVESAISHWAPRFIANGVDYSDFRLVTSRIAGWDQWCERWCEAAAVHEGLGRAALERGNGRSAGGHLAQAAVYFHFGKFMFVQNLDEMRAAHLRGVECLQDALPHLDPPAERVEIPFEGTVLAAILRRPAGPGPHPIVIMIPGLDSAKEEFRSTEETFLSRGLATLSVDGPGQGEAEYELAIRGDWEVPAAAIVDAVTRLPAIDPDRIGIWGVSLGGYYAARAASGEHRLRACISLCGPYCLGDIWDGLPELSRNAFRVRSKSASEEEARAAASQLSMAGRAGGLTMPLLIIMGKRDRIFPWQDAQRLHDEVGPTAELMLIEDGNHGCANVTYRHRPYGADWMARQLAA